jgi:hypothetical protein
MEVIKTTVGHHLLNMFTENVALIIASLLVEDEEENRSKEMYANMLERLYGTTRKNKKAQFDKYCKNLRYDAFNVYSYSTAVIQLNWKRKTAKRLGKWSPTTSKHMNYAIKMLIANYNFRELK